MAKSKCLLLIVVFCLLFVGNAYAADHNLVEWGSNPVCSDPHGTVDGMDPDNPNLDDKMDVGCTTCSINMKGNLECVIENGYPGYQVYINAIIENVSRHPVKITGVRFVNKPECILATLADAEGHYLSQATIDKNSNLAVQVVTRVAQSSEQASVYDFEIIIEAQQEQIHEGGGNNGGGDSNSPGETPSEQIVENPGEPPIKQPGEKERELIKLPLDLPVELPKTGASVILMVGVGLALGGIGMSIRRKRK